MRQRCARGWIYHVISRQRIAHHSVNPQKQRDDGWVRVGVGVGELMA